MKFQWDHMSEVLRTKPEIYVLHINVHYSYYSCSVSRAQNKTDIYIFAGCLKIWMMVREAISWQRIIGFHGFRFQLCHLVASLFEDSPPLQKREICVYPVGLLWANAFNTYSRCGFRWAERGWGCEVATEAVLGFSKLHMKTVRATREQNPKPMYNIYN